MLFTYNKQPDIIEFTGLIQRFIAEDYAFQSGFYNLYCAGECCIKVNL